MTEHIEDEIIDESDVESDPDVEVESDGISDESDEVDSDEYLKAGAECAVCGCSCECHYDTEILPCTECICGETCIISPSDLGDKT
jgi:hypothetical protein